METKLVVVRSFGLRALGETITDPVEVEAVLAGDHAADVVRVLIEPEET